MDDMVVSDVVQEETSLPTEEVAINRSRRTALEVPFLATIVRKFWGGVMKISNHDD